MRSVRRFAQICGFCWAIVASLQLASCVYDAGDRCGPQQQISSVGACVCVAGLVLRGTACVPCPDHELELNGACRCEEGYERPADGQACAPVVEAGLGTACSSDAQCTDPSFGVCRKGGVAGDYCTSVGCASADDCGGGFGCNDKQATPFCERPPLGQAATCATSDDCAGTDATFCDSYISQRCLVPDCSLETPSCSAGWECCDISSAGLPGLPKTVCVTAGDCSL